MNHQNTMNQLQLGNPPISETMKLTRLLNERFGDGRVILRTASDHKLVKVGRNLGFITQCGYVTPAGRLLAAEMM